MLSGKQYCDVASTLIGTRYSNISNRSLKVEFKYDETFSKSIVSKERLISRKIVSKKKNFLKKKINF